MFEGAVAILKCTTTSLVVDGLDGFPVCDGLKVCVFVSHICCAFSCASLFYDYDWQHYSKGHMQQLQIGLSTLSSIYSLHNAVFPYGLVIYASCGSLFPLDAESSLPELAVLSTECSEWTDLEESYIEETDETSSLLQARTCKAIRIRRRIFEYCVLEPTLVN